MRPEEALERARAAAREREADYAGDPALRGEAIDQVVEPGGVSPALLREWAIIDIDPGSVYSTRRLGAPITFLKRMLLRLLRQYTAELEARQTRFNVALLARLEELERKQPR